ncbi:hypothetical protein C8R46DRAFT_547113 [Mycena filopes]|nr:hypothetical protein C8R46DRAFT_547113 [Mycena filopes]
MHYPWYYSTFVSVRFRGARKNLVWFFLLAGSGCLHCKPRYSLANRSGGSNAIDAILFSPQISTCCFLHFGSSSGINSAQVSTSMRQVSSQGKSKNIFDPGPPQRLQFMTTGI